MNILGTMNSYHQLQRTAAELNAQRRFAERAQVLNAARTLRAYAIAEFGEKSWLEAARVANERRAN